MKMQLTKQLLTVFLCTNTFLSAFVFGQTVKVVNGCITIDILTTSPVPGNFYYVLYKTKLAALPLGTSVKADAQIVPSNSISRNGTIKVTSLDLKDTLTRTLSGIPSNSVLHLYVVFENANGVFGNVTYQQIETPIRQIGYTYTTQVASIPGSTIRYMVYKSESYLKDTKKKKHPLIVYFHGDPKSTDINILKSAGLPQYLDKGNNIDFIVVSPLTYYPVLWYAQGWIDELVEKIKKEERIDVNRIYLTGLSSGGGGIYYYASNFSQKVSAIVTACAVNPFWNTDFPDPHKNNYCAVKNIPVWAFHNQTDNTVNLNNSATIVNSINACTPAPPVEAQLTVYNKTGHDAWTATYQNSNIYKWFLGIVKTAPANKPPVITTTKDLTLSGNGNPLSLTASAVDPENGKKITFSWYLKLGPDITLKNLDSSKLSLQDYSSGTYSFRVTATDELGASSYEDVNLTITSNFPTALPTESVELSATRLFYPNPTENKIYFESSCDYSIHSSSGIQVQSGRGDHADLSALDKGIYFITINGLTNKLVKH